MRKSKHLILSAIVLTLLIGTIVFISSDQRFFKCHSQNQAGKQIWYCPMHPWIKSDKPGVCPICGMALVPGHTHNESSEASSIPGYAIVDISPGRQELAGIHTETVNQKGKTIIIPKDAVMNLGSQKLVFIEKEGSKFEPRKINARNINDEIVVTSGLEKGEQIAVSGVFLLDSESQIQASLKEGDGND